MLLLISNTIGSYFYLKRYINKNEKAEFLAFFFHINVEKQRTAFYKFPVKRTEKSASKNTYKEKIKGIEMYSISD